MSVFHELLKAYAEVAVENDGTEKAKFLTEMCNMSANLYRIPDFKKRDIFPLDDLFKQAEDMIAAGTDPDEVYADLFETILNITLGAYVAATDMLMSKSHSDPVDACNKLSEDFNT